MAAKDNLTPEEKAMLKSAWLKDPVDTSSLSSERKALMKQAWLEAVAEHGDPSGPAKPEQSAWDTAKSVGGTALDLGLRGLDYAGGVARTGVYGAADEFAQAAGIYDEDRIDSGEAFEKALRGQAPTSADNLDDMGAGKMGTMNMPVLGEISTRGALGLASDIAMDPLTYATFGASGIAKVLKGGAKLKNAAATGKAISTVTKGAKAGQGAKVLKTVAKAGKTLLRPLRKLETKAGKGLYKFALRKTDEVASKIPGVADDAVSTIAAREGLTGNAQKVAKQVDSTIEKMGHTKNNIMGEVSSKGFNVDPTQRLAKISNDLDEIIEASTNINLQPGGKVATLSMADDARQLKGQVTQYLDQGVFDVNQADNIKQQLSEMINWAPDTSDFKRTVLKDLRKTFKESVEATVSVAAPKKYKAFVQNNKDIGTLLNTKKQFAKEAGKEITKGFPVTQTKAGVMLDSPLAGTAMFATDFLRGSRATTNMGKALIRDPGVADTLLRQSIIRSNREPRSKDER